MKLKSLFLLSIACVVQGRHHGRMNYAGSPFAMFDEPDAFELKLRTLRNLGKITPFFSNANFNPQLVPVQQSVQIDRKMYENEIVPGEPTVEPKEVTTVTPNNEDSKVVPEEVQIGPKASSSKLDESQDKPKEEVASSKVNFEVDFQVDMPNPSDDKTSKAPITEKVEDTTTTKKPEAVQVLDEGKLSASLLLSLLTGSNLPRKTKPAAPVAVKSKCDEITCLQPPKELSCHLQKASIKINNPENSKFEELSDCCPLWLCTKPDGSFHTHYGMIGKIDKEKEVAPPASHEEAIPFISFSEPEPPEPQQQEARDKSKIPHMLLFRNIYKTTKFSPKVQSFSFDSGLNEFSPFENLGSKEPMPLSGASLGSSQNGEMSFTGPFSMDLPQSGLFSSSIKTQKSQSSESDYWNQLMGKLKMSSGGQLMLQQEQESPQAQVPVMFPFFPPGLI